MKRFFLFAVAVLAFVGCNNAFEDEHYARLEQNVLPTLTTGFEDATRTYVEQNTYLRWHADDRLTIFYGNTLNRQYKFNGKTGDNSGSFSHIPSGDIETGNSFDHIYAVYPYDANIDLEDINKSLSLTLPAVQEYAEESFGNGANTMVAVTKNTSDTFLGFKNVCGYLKIKLYGEGTVMSLTVKGNNNEKIAGAATITMAYGETPQLTMATDATKSITLDCGEGVALSNNANNPTEFWVVVPPTTFNKGITVTATDLYGSTFEQSTSNKVVVERNQIQPMAAVAVEFEEVAKPANNEIWYTAGAKVVPYYDDEFGATLLSNNYDSTTKEGVLTFDSDVTKIGDKAFYECNKLASVTIPDSVTTIGGRAFYYCTFLTSVTIPNSVTTIGEMAFEGCDRLTSVTIGDSVTTIGDYAFIGCDRLTSVTIGDSVTTIGNWAFQACESLTSVTIPDSVTTIGKEAFAYCESLTSVTIGDSVTTIGSDAFYGCSSLTSVTIPDSVTTIGNYAFFGCDNLTSVTIPDSVTTIGDGAFCYCDSLTSVTIPDSVTTIGYRAFEGCDSLTSVTIPDSVTTIGKRAFVYCDRLTSVTIGDSVTTIGESAFCGCSKLKSVYSKPTTPPSMDYYVFSDTNIQAIYVPTGSVEAYKTAYYWKSYADKIEGYEF